MIRAGGSFSRALSVVGTTCLLLSACDLSPDYETPKVELGEGYRNEPAPGLAELPHPASTWWRNYGSAELDALVEEALANNHDLKAATQRVAQAQAQAGVAISPMLPTVTGTAKNTLTSPRDGIATTSVNPMGKSERELVFNAAVSYELDLWGKNRLGWESALSSAMSNVYDRETVSTTLVAEVVSNYMQFIQASERLAVARRTIGTMESGVEAMRERVRLGESTEIELAQQRHQLATAYATVPPLQRSREEARDRLAALLGRPPRTLQIKTDSFDNFKPPVIGPGMPSDMLLRRPDIRKAEANLMAANANIGAARAKLLPSFSLTGERGQGSQWLGVLISPTSLYYNVAASITQTLFDFGKLDSEIDSAKARKEELAETYAQTVMNALRDTEDALAATRYTAEAQDAQQAVVDLARHSYSLAQEAFKLGMVDFLYLLESERAQYSAEDNLAQAKYNRMNASVLLFKALGGGFEDESGRRYAAAPQVPEGWQAPNN